jgi:hypothetical protein
VGQRDVLMRPRAGQAQEQKSRDSAEHDDNVA